MRSTFRSYGVLVAAVMIVTAAACSQSPSPASPSPAAGVSASEAGDASSAASASAAQPVGPELAAVRSATERFHDIGAAEAAGYISPAIIGECVEVPSLGAMGIHSPNPPLTTDQSVDPLRPEVLLYVPKKGGGHRLVGVEYVMTALVSINGTVGPFVRATLPTGATVVTPRPSLFGQSFNGPMPGHEPGMPWHYDLHAWVWKPNPSGMFAQFNPAISCGAN